MIPGTILIFAQRHWKAILAVSTALFLSGGWYLAEARADRWQAKAELIQSHFDTYKAEVKATAAEMFSNALKRVVDDANARNSITVEISNGYKAENTRLRAVAARRLRAQSGGGAGAAGGTDAVSLLPAASCRINGTASGSGLWALSPACAVTIMLAADENTAKLEALQSWVSKQGVVTIPVD